MQAVKGSGQTDASGDWAAGIRRLLGKDETMVRVYHNAKSRSVLRGIPFALTESDFAKLVLRAGGRCELTGIPFRYECGQDVRRRPFAPSLDRIDRRYGYDLANCRLVCVAINIALNEWGEGTFMVLASAYLERNRPVDKHRRGTPGARLITNG
jgi:hypothetical protein